MNREVSTAAPAAPLSGLSSQTLPSAGTRVAIARPPGSGDALLLAETATAAQTARRLLVVVAADALDAQRLVDEIRYFAPALTVRPLPSRLNPGRRPCITRSHPTTGDPAP